MTNVWPGLLPDPAPGQEWRGITGRHSHCAWPTLADHPSGQDIPVAGWLLWVVFAERDLPRETREGLLLALGLDPSSCGDWASADRVKAANHVSGAAARDQISLKRVQEVTGRKRGR